MCTKYMHKDLSRFWRCYGEAGEQPNYPDVLNKGHELDARVDATELGGESIEERFHSAEEN